jgi:ABC-type nitrate/sulfonate/bicarbonate transport system substrate-binding protein
LAAKDWGAFAANGLDVELIVMSPSIAAAALAQGDVDYVAGVGPASVAATLSGLPSRAIWFSSDRISYWLMARPQFKSLEDLKGKKIAISGGAGGTNHVALVVALEKSGANPKDYAMVGIPGQQIQVLYSLESNFVEGALISPPVTFNAYKKGFNKLLDVGSMVEMPGGGLTALIKTIQSRPAEAKRVIHALQSAKDEVRKSKSKTVELIIRLLKMDKEAASETYDTFLTTLNPSGISTARDRQLSQITGKADSDRKIAFTTSPTTGHRRSEGIVTNCRRGPRGKPFRPGVNEIRNRVKRLELLNFLKAHTHGYIEFRCFSRRCGSGGIYRRGAGFGAGREGCAH